MQASGGGEKGEAEQDEALTDSIGMAGKRVTSEEGKKGRSLRAGWPKQKVDSLSGDARA